MRNTALALALAATLAAGCTTDEDITDVTPAPEDLTPATDDTDPASTHPPAEPAGTDSVTPTGTPT